MFELAVPDLYPQAGEDRYNSDNIPMNVLTSELIYIVFDSKYQSDMLTINLMNRIWFAFVVYWISNFLQKCLLWRMISFWQTDKILIPSLQFDESGQNFCYTELSDIFKNILEFMQAALVHTDKYQPWSLLY